MHTAVEITIQVEGLLELFKRILVRIKLLLEKLEGVSKPEISSVISVTILSAIYFKFYCSLDLSKEPSIEGRPRSKFSPGLPCFSKHFLSGGPPFV